MILFRAPMSISGRTAKVAVMAALINLLPIPAGHSEDAPKSQTATDFASASGTHFMLQGKPYFVAGVNNHYLTYGKPSEVIGVLDDAVAIKAKVIRTFLQPVIGSVDGVTVPTIWDWKSQAEVEQSRRQRHIHALLGHDQ